MGVVSAIVAAVKAITLVSVVKFVGTTLLTIGISKLMAKRAMKKASAGADGGGRVQLPPATDNKIPVVYGTAFVGGPIIDAKISTDQKTMWYVVALAEHTDTTVSSGYSFGTIYYDGKKVNYGVNGAVASLEVNNQGTAQLDTRVAGKLWIYQFTNGSGSGVNTGGQTAYDILSDAQIPVNQRWDSNDAMTNCCFVIVKVIYNVDAGTTSLGAITAQITNSVTKPGDVILDYMLNTRYGCAIPSDRIDTQSLTDLNTYSDQTITYVPVGGGSATQTRYRINGPLDTANDCLTNLQILVDGCDSWLQYSELTGKWRVVMNKAYDQAPNSQTLNDLFLVNDDNIVGGITISPIDLNETYNEVEVAYPNQNIKDQTDYQVIELADYVPSVLSPNEAVNRLNLTLPVVNNAVQAKYLAVRRLLQSREDLVISFATDYSGIQVLAGDLIRVTFSVYGWTDKVFRVSSVAEEKYEDGSLGARLIAFEYNGTIYNDNSIQNFVPAFNTGLTNPSIITQPGAPNIANVTAANSLVTAFTVTSWVPDQGTVIYMDFNYGANSNVETHQLYRTVQSGPGAPFTNSDSANSTYTNVTISINDIPKGNYYFSTTARNDISGRISNASALFTWDGTTINAYNPNANTGGLPGNVYIPNTIQANNLVNSSIGLQQLANSLGVTQSIGGNTFSVRQGNPLGNLAGPLLPVYANGNVTRNVPLYIVGTAPASINNYWPYAQGTSITTPGNDGNNYYVANSTAAWTPSNAAILLIADGEDDWYMVSNEDFASGTVQANQAFYTNQGLIISSDTVDTIVQIIPGFKIGNNAYYEMDTNDMASVTINDIDIPYLYVRNRVVVRSSSDTTGVATFVRNITSGSTITIASGSIVASKGIAPFY